MFVVFIGPPGAGKGTQCARLLEWLRIPHLSTGEMLRFAVGEGLALGQQAQQYMRQGRLVPDALVLGIVQERLSQPDCREGCLFDGFPRTLGQARSLDDYLNQRGTPVDVVLDMVVEEQELLRRLVARRRADDEIATIQKRLDVFTSQTRPLLDYYRRQGKLAEIDGSGSPDDVSQRIRDVVLAARASEGQDAADHGGESGEGAA